VIFLNRKTIVATSLLMVLVLVWFGHRWMESDIAMPPPVDERLHIKAVERRAWGDVANQIDDILVVARGRYALVSTNIDLDNIEVLEKRGGTWVRITPNGWGDNVDRWSLIQIGIPFSAANALVNGMRYQWHHLGGGPDVPVRSFF
jgi:hypothetical protein